MRLRYLLVTAIAALVLAACQPSASSSPSVEPSGSDQAIPSFVGDPELEATLPISAGGVTFIRVSMSGPDFIEGDPSPRFLDFIDALDADIEDVSVAVAIGGNLEGDKTASVLAFRVQGADSAELVDVFKETADAEADPLVWHPETISGKEVEVADPNEDFPTPIALYPTGEVMYFVSSSDEAVLEAVLAKLP